MRGGGFGVRVTAWNDGNTTCGIRIGKPNRDQHFRREWTQIEIELNVQFHRLQLTAGFWNECPEFRSPIIRAWLGRHGMLKWPKGSPPTLDLQPPGGNRFRLAPAIRKPS